MLRPLWPFFLIAAGLVLAWDAVSQADNAATILSEKSTFGGFTVRAPNWR
jgi:hypothetical protein